VLELQSSRGSSRRREFCCISGSHLVLSHHRGTVANTIDLVVVALVFQNELVVALKGVFLSCRDLCEG
jgi:hypothetical protein